MNQPAYDALRTYRYVYVQYANGERELYDLERDPDQLTSLHNDPAYAQVQADLALRLGLLSVCRGRACRARPSRGSRCAAKARVRGSGIDRVIFRSALRVPRTAGARSARRWAGSACEPAFKRTMGAWSHSTGDCRPAAREGRSHTAGPNTARVVVLEAPLRVEARAHFAKRSLRVAGSRVAADW